MFKKLLVIGLLCLLTSTVFAEDWREFSNGIEYDCDVYSELTQALDAGDLGDIGPKIISRNADGVEISVFEYVGLSALVALEKVPDAKLTKDILLLAASTACSPDETATSTSSGEGLFNVVVNDGANIRSCAGTNCSVVRQAKRGEVLAVIAVEGEWYEIQNESGPAFIADFLVSRGPDAVVDVDEGYTDSELGCIVVFDIKRGDPDLSIVMAGEKQDDIVVDLYRPNGGNALTVEGQLDKTFIDTGDPYILQYYAWNTGWSLGTYRLEVGVGDQTRMLAWEMETKGDYTIHVYCD